MDRDFSLGGNDFRLSKLDAFKQFHIVRRIGPILSDIIPAMKGLPTKTGADLENASESEKLDAIAKIAGPVMNGLSKLSDADADLVLNGLLSAVEMKQKPGNWAKISNGTMVMFHDLELPTLLQLAGKAFMFNLSGFFGALPQKPG